MARQEAIPHVGKKQQNAMHIHFIASPLWVVHTRPVPESTEVVGQEGAGKWRCGERDEGREEVEWDGGGVEEAREVFQEVRGVIHEYQTGHGMGPAGDGVAQATC